MNVTLEGLLAFQHQNVRTLTHKIILLAVKNGQDETGWASLSLADLRNLTGLSTSAVKEAVSKLVDLSLIEKTRDDLMTHDKTKYRYLNP